MPDRKMKISIGCDHAGYEMKAWLVEQLGAAGYEVHDVGTDGTASVDYPVYARAACDKVAAGNCDMGILVCGSGVGMSIAANKVRGIRAVLCNEPVTARMSRLHNNSNVLCIGGRFVGNVMAWEIVTTWLSTSFEGGRHCLRVDMLEPAGEDLVEE